MRLKAFAFVVAAVLALGAGVTVHPAAAHAAPPATATATADGTGMLELRGRIDAQLTARYPVLLVHDNAGDATVTGTGAPAVNFLGFRAYFSMGNAHVRGSDVTIVLVGEQLHAGASGQGWLFVKGSGSYTANSLTAHAWLPAGSVAAIAPPATTGGLFVAHGAGAVAVRGGLTYEASLGAGVLLVHDVAGDATVDVTGALTHGEFLGFTAYAGATGARITGTDVVVVAAGVDVNVTAAGSGWAYAQGLGVSSVNNAASTEWELSGRFADITR